MKAHRPVAVVILCTVFSVGFVSVAMAGMLRDLVTLRFEGQIKSVKIDKCGQQPGTCEGSIVLARKGGEEVALAIKPGTWMTRGEKFVLIDELKVGDNVQARGIILPGATTPQLTDIDATD